MIRVETPDTIKDIDELASTMREYLGVVHATLVEDGGPGFDVDDAMNHTLDNLGKYLPPDGRTFLARDGSGILIATAYLKFPDVGTAEIKRLYVRPEGRGNGLGRRLTKMAMDDAKSRGAGRMVLDTLSAFGPARGLYESLGFKYINRYWFSEIPHELDPWVVFMERPL